MKSQKALPDRQTKSLQSGFAPVLILGLVVVAGSVLFLIYKNFGISKQNLTIPDISPASLEATTSFTGKQAVLLPTTGWVKYVSPDDRFELLHPQEWQIESSSKEEWTAFSRGDVQGTFIRLSKSDYEIKISFYSAYDPGHCIFQDNPNYKNDGRRGECPGDFIEIKSGDIVRRRWMQGHQWVVYEKEFNDYFFESPPIIYSMPTKYDEEILKTMDTIISTFNEKN